MNIKENSIDSISLGLEDYNNITINPKRILSATRNLYSGILLLFKYKISLLDPNQNIKGLNLRNLREALSKHQVDIDSDELSSIQKFRNDIEHHSSPIPPDDRDILISNVFIVLRDFIVNHLHEDPEVFLGKDSYQILVQANEVYLAEKNRLKKITSAQLHTHPELIDWIQKSYCPDCHNDLLYIHTFTQRQDLNTQLISCKYCNNRHTFYDFFIKKSELGYYAAMRGKGYAYPIIKCIDCNDGFINFNLKRCYSCHTSISTKCSNCGDNLNIYCEIELSDNKCSYCSYSYQKFMAD